MAMATDNHSAARSEKSNKGRLFLTVLGLIVLVSAIWLAFNFANLKGLLTVGTGYGARVACSCHYIGGRDLTDCEKDFEPGMEIITLSKNDDKRRVTASVPLIASATAQYREGWGCQLLSEEQLEQE